MGRPKKNATEKKQPAQPRKDPRIENVYEEEVTFTCPVRGVVTQKVKIKRYKPLEEKGPGVHLTATIDEITAKLEEQDDGLSIYSDGEELGITDVPEGE